MAIPSFDRLFPTMAIGSLPRPRWVVEIVRDRLAGALAAAPRHQRAVHVYCVSGDRSTPHAMCAELLAATRPDA